MDENFDGNNQGPGFKPRGKIRGISDFLLIIRDRWLLAITLALPIALGYVYNELQVPEYYSLVPLSDSSHLLHYLIYRK